MKKLLFITMMVFSSILFLNSCTSTRPACAAYVGPLMGGVVDHPQSDMFYPQNVVEDMK